VPLPQSRTKVSSVCVTNTFLAVPPSGTLDTVQPVRQTWNFQLKLGDGP